MSSMFAEYLQRYREWYRQVSQSNFALGAGSSQMYWGAPSILYQINITRNWAGDGLLMNGMFVEYRSIGKKAINRNITNKLSWRMEMEW